MFEKKIQVVVIFFAICGWLYFFYTPVLHIISDQRAKARICKKPIQYSIGSFDNKFGISKEDFIKDTEEATKLWEDVSGLDLFEYNPSSKSLPISLVYDERQNTTTGLGSLEQKIDASKTQISLEDSNLSSLEESYKNKKSVYQSLFNQYSGELKQYNDEIALLNTRGRITAQEVSLYNSRKAILDEKLLKLKTLESEINSLASTLNKESADIHTQVNQVNKNIETFNQKINSFSEEFNEGEYIQKDGTQNIYVYQFDNREHLIRLLAHEFGHSLGIEHVDDKNAVMYRLNNSDKLTLTQADKDALNTICHNNNSILSKVFHSII